MEDNSQVEQVEQVEQVDWQQKVLELQLQVEQSTSKLRDSIEMTRLLQFYITQLQQERETATVAKTTEMLQKHKDHKEQQAPTP